MVLSPPPPPTQPLKSATNEGWGMGLLFIFFHNNNNNNNNNNHDEESLYTHTHKPTSKRASLSLPPSSSLLLSKTTQSTLSICGLLVFTTLLVFTLSTFEPATSAAESSRRRFLQQQEREGGAVSSRSGIAPALQGMGELYLRGSKGMTDMIVAHAHEELTESELRSFVRVVYNSGLLARSDLVFVFASPVAGLKFAELVRTECDSFVRLVRMSRELGRFDGVRTELGPGLTRYLREVGEGDKEPIWGKKRGNSTSVVGGTELSESTRTSYGSVVGFDSSELDPEDSLSGFLDHVPMSLRRWACYPMLLGRVRRNYKHIMLVDVKNSLILADPFSRVRNRSSESVFMWSNSVPEAELTRHGRRNSGKGHNQDHTKRQLQLNPGVIVGGSRGVRRFANAALTEIVRGTIEHKGKNRNAVTESGLVNQLVHSGHLLKNINLITPTEPIPDSGALAGFNSAESGSSFLRLTDYFSVVQRGHNTGGFDLDHLVMREICASHKLYSSVYSDCLSSQ